MRTPSSRFLGAALLAVATLSGCGKEDDSRSTSPGPRPSTTGTSTVASEPQVELHFLYGSEKKSWLAAATQAFQDSGAKTSSGKLIRVKLAAMGSGETVEAVQSGRVQAHLVSPASGVFIKLANAESRAKTGGDLIGKTENLVVSPVVLGMWRPMAEAIGWGKQPVGWSDILSLAREPRGWAVHGHPEWGAFRFGHTHPEYSNSGLISVLAEVYAATGKTRGLEKDDVAKPEVGTYVESIEKAVVHYGSSTGFFADKMFSNGPQYLSAAVMYESNVIESYARPGRSLDVVAIYPKEGTFWSDHPAGVVQRPWVTDEHRDAAAKYLAFLLSKPQQERALEHGFRPADPAVPLAAPFDAAHGVDPKEPQTTLEVPGPDVAGAILKLWRERKKHANVVLVIDTSGSMKEDDKMRHARDGARQLVSMLGDEDVLSLLTFSSQFRWAGQLRRMKDHRDQVVRTIDGLFPDGGTRLFDSIAEGYDFMAKNPSPDRISAVVVLTDGEDTDSSLKLDPLLSRIRFDNEKRPIRVFTIGYGKGARKDELKKIADRTEARFYEGTPANIREVFKEIATFF